MPSSTRIPTVKTPYTLPHVNGKLIPSSFPHGLIVVEDFFTPEEQKQIMDIVDANPFSQLIHRYVRLHCYWFRRLFILYFL